MNHRLEPANRSWLEIFQCCVCVFRKNGYCRAAWVEDFVLRVNTLTGYLMKAVGPLLVICAIALISTVIYAHFTVILPVYTESSEKWWIHHILSVYLTLCIYVHYLKATFKDPGYPLLVELSEEEIEEFKCTPLHRDVGRSRWCKKCEQPKAPRTHHCSFCNKCVLHFDHHCKPVLLSLLLLTFFCLKRSMDC